ncbi:MAG: tyrosine-type recombinase/integrase [Acidimicrobiales bacterium]|nr:tyrosine-type recombinase/integrase [Acidimicrobiales bacterium]
MVVANDAVTGRSVQRSFTVHGTEPDAQARRRELVARFGVHRRSYCAAATWTVAELLERFLAAAHDWQPATRSSHASVARFLATDTIGASGVTALSPATLEARLGAWRAAGASDATVFARWSVLHSALSWATRLELLRVHPFAGMRTPRRPEPRKHLLPAEIATLLRTTQAAVDAAHTRLATHPHSQRALQALFIAEQNQLLVRLAADTGARRGELAVLRARDLDGRILTIERNLSLEVLGPTKTKRTRRLTIGATTAAMITTHLDTWHRRLNPGDVDDDWLFAPDPTRHTHTRADTLSHRFHRVRTAAGLPHAALHRFRHSVATALVEDGKILKAQARLGHRDPATTLRHYAHATPLDDLDIADAIDHRLNQATA